MLKFAAFVAFLVWALYEWLSKDFGTFSERGVKFEVPVVIFGNFWNAAFGKESVLCPVHKLYNKFYNEK